MGGVWRRVVALGLVTVFALTGCARSRAQADSPRALASTSSTGPVLASGQRPVVSPAASGPVRGVDGWVAALSRASDTASLVPLRAWALPTCPCLAGVAKSLNALSAQHLHLDADYQLAGATLIARQGADADVAVLVTWRPYDVLTASGMTVRTEAAGRQSSRYSLREEGARWLVAVIS